MAEIFPVCGKHCKPYAGSDAGRGRCLFNPRRTDDGRLCGIFRTDLAIANPMRQMGNIMNEFQRFSAASKK